MDSDKLPIDVLNSLAENQNTVLEINPIIELKKNLVGYINSLINTAVEDDELLKETKKQILKKIPELEFKDLKTLFTALNSKKETLNYQLTNLLKPSQQNNSPLLDALSDVKSVDQDDFDLANDDMSSEELRNIDKIDKFMHMLEKVETKIKEKEEEYQIN